MDWIKWRLPPSPRLPFIMQLFFSGSWKAWEAVSYSAASRRTRSGDRCKKMSRGIKGIEETFTLHTFFSYPPLSLCRCSLFRRLELVLATLPLKLFFLEAALVENIKLVFVPRNGFQRAASAECTYWFPRSGERHLQLQERRTPRGGSARSNTDVGQLASM